MGGFGTQLEGVAKPSATPGTGSVGLFWLAQQPLQQAELTSLEAQEESVELLNRTVTLLGLEEKVQVVHGDLRNEAAHILALI